MAPKVNAMSIVILVGGRSREGNYEHRYLVEQFLQAFPDDVKCVITTDPVQRSIKEKIRRTLKRGNYAERVRRALYNRANPLEESVLGETLFPHGAPQQMPGAERVNIVPGHNSRECADLIKKLEPEVIVYYRGDSTLFWPVYYNQKDKLGVTVHKLVPEVDAGGIVSTGLVTYEKGDSEDHIFAKGVIIGAELYIEAVRAALEKTIVFHKQDLQLGQEFRWVDRTVAAEKQVKKVLQQWAKN